jgi:hypothetical protein
MPAPLRPRIVFLWRIRRIDSTRHTTPRMDIEIQSKFLSLLPSFLVKTKVYCSHCDRGGRDVAENSDYEVNHHTVGIGGRHCPCFGVVGKLSYSALKLAYSGRTSKKITISIPCADSKL